MRFLALLVLLTGCIEIVGVPENVRIEHVLVPPECPVPAPVVNDMNQLPSSYPLGCPYQIEHPDGTRTTHTFEGFDPPTSPDTLPTLPLP